MEYLFYYQPLNEIYVITDSPFLEIHTNNSDFFKIKLDDFMNNSVYLGTL